MVSFVSVNLKSSDVHVFAFLIIKLPLLSKIEYQLKVDSSLFPLLTFPSHFGRDQFVHLIFFFNSILFMQNRICTINISKIESIDTNVIQVEATIIDLA